MAGTSQIATYSASWKQEKLRTDCCVHTCVHVENNTIEHGIMGSDS